MLGNNINFFLNCMYVMLLYDNIYIYVMYVCVFFLYIVSMFLMNSGK